MNKFCHIGFSQIQELYNQHVEQIDSALQHCKETPCTNGMAGEPVPYQLRNDFAITGIVFLCFFLVTYSLKNGQKPTKKRFCRYLPRQTPAVPPPSFRPI